MTHFTLGQSLVFIASGGAGWLMIRAGAAKKQLTLRERSRCASCGRRFVGKTCSCALR